MKDDSNRPRHESSSIDTRRHAEVDNFVSSLVPTWEKVSAGPGSSGASISSADVGVFLIAAAALNGPPAIDALHLVHVV